MDGNNLLYRAYYKYSNMRSSNGLLSSVVYGVPYVIRGMLSQHDPDDMVVVFDGGRHAKRMELYPEYKAKRKQKITFDKENFYQQRDEAIKILSYLGVKHVLMKGMEADDIIWLMAKKLKRKNHVVIVSSDKDFNQLVSENLSVWNPKDSKRYTHKNIDSELGFSVKRFVDFLILDGDVSDNIKGMIGVGPAKAKDFISRTKSISNYLISGQEEIKSFQKNLLEPVFLLNRQLIDIRLFCRRHLKGTVIPIHVPKAKIKKGKLALICSKYEITTFIKKDFLKSFDKLLTKNSKIKVWQRKCLSWDLLE